ncbi:MAG: hypothetical protein Q4G03_10915 [Planctomycetia bacterium]|nr:hypothetical protein [Planctomycetia bacterium]
MTTVLSLDNPASLARADAYFKTRLRAAQWFTLDHDQRAALLDYAAAIIDANFTLRRDLELTERSVVTACALTIELAIYEEALWLTCEQEQTCARLNALGVTRAQIGTLNVELTDQLRSTALAPAASALLVKYAEKLENANGSFTSTPLAL